jgi:hypothetical protein
VSVIVAAVIMAIAAVGVLRWLPSRAADHAEEAVPGREPSPEAVAALGVGPADVTPAAPAAVLADELALADDR